MVGSVPERKIESMKTKICVEVSVYQLLFWLDDYYKTKNDQLYWNRVIFYVHNIYISIW